MPEDVRIWEVSSSDNLVEVQQAKLNLEERIENWLENDISMLSEGLLVIGRQVKTAFGGFIDILCLSVTPWNRASSNSSRTGWSERWGSSDSWAEPARAYQPRYFRRQMRR